MSASNDDLKPRRISSRVASFNARGQSAAYTALSDISRAKELDIQQVPFFLEYLSSTYFE